MSDSATKETTNTTRIEDAGPSRKKLVIEIPAEAVDEKLDESILTLASEAELPGFRKGRAPRALIQKRFGEAVRNEAKNALVASAYQEAVEEHKLKVVGDPISDELPDLVLEPGKPLSITIDIEVAPEFTMPEIEGIEIYKPEFEVSDEMVASEVEKICINEGDLEERETPEPGDYLTGHGIMRGTPAGSSEEKEFYNIPGAVVQVPPPEKEGKGMVLGVMVDDFSKQLGLPKPGETVTIKVKGPDNHEVEDIRGTDLTVTFQIDRVDRIIPAELNTVVDRYGFQFADELRETVRSRLKQRAIIRQQVAMRQQIADYLVEHTEIDLPERLTAGQAARTLDRRRMELAYRGVPENEIEEHIAELRASSDKSAVRELKLFFVLNQIADDLEVTVTEGEMNGRIAQLASEQGVRPEKLRQELIRRNRVGQIFSQIREHKAMDEVVKKAKVTDISADDFAEKMKAKQQDA